MKSMENRKHLGFLIRVARKERNLTQNELAKRLKTKQPNIARAENKGCGLDLAERAVNILGFEITNISLRNKNPFESGLQFHS